MTSNIKKVLSAVLCICLIFSFSVIAFAEPEFETDSFDPVVEETVAPIIPENTTEDVIQDDFNNTTTTDVPETEVVLPETVTQSQTTSGGFSGILNIIPISPKPTTTTPAETWEQPTTQRPNSNQGGNNKPRPQEDETTTTTQPEETTEEPLPDGSYYVYLERNNGERRLKLVMTGTGYVTVPDIPYRQGFTFVGWYSDPDFEKPWDFFKDKASETMTFYAKWEKNPETVIYKITVDKIKNGKIEVNPSEASEGEVVFINITPDEGKRLVAGSLKINGKSTDFFTFTMPAGEVKVSALFENIPKEELNGDDKNAAPYIIIAVILVLIIVSAVIIIIKKKNDFVPEYDPDNPDIDDDGEDVWIDETIVVEDAFQNGIKVKKDEFIPEYGIPEDENEEL